MYGKIQTHVNIKSARAELSKIVKNTAAKNLLVVMGEDQQVVKKLAAIDMIQRGFFDGWFARFMYLSSKHLRVELQPNHVISKGLFNPENAGWTKIGN